MVSQKVCICVLSNLLNVMRINRDLETKKGLLYNERWKLKKLQSSYAFRTFYKSTKYPRIFMYIIIMESKYAPMILCSKK